MKRRRLNTERGFTLVETMLVVALSALVFYSVFIILRSGSIQANVIGNKMIMEDSARDGLSRMLQEIRETAPGRIAIAANQISFDVPAGIDSDGTVLWGDRVTYLLGGLNNTQLVRSAAPAGGAAVLSVVANDVQSVNFTPNDPADPTVITIQMNVQRQTSEGRIYSETLTGRGKVRNE